MTDPLAALVKSLTDRWGKPAISPPESAEATACVLADDGLVWIDMGHHNYRRAWAWLVNGYNCHLCADRKGSQLREVRLGGAGRVVELTDYSGGWPSSPLIEAAALWAFGLGQL